MTEVGYVIFTFRVHREDDQYVSECVELGVASCGDTLDEAFAQVEDATTLYVNTLEAEGERVRVFEERGITIQYGPYPDQADRIAVHPCETVTRRPLDLPFAFA